MGESEYFYGLQPRWIRGNRLFRIYVLKDAISGAYIAGQVYDEESGYVHWISPAGWLGWTLKPLVRRAIRKREEREAMYDDLVPGSTDFLWADRRNFLINRSEVERVSIQPRPALWTGSIPNTGSIRFQLWDGQRLRFILVGEQPVSQVHALLSRSLGPVELTGVADRV